MEEKCRMEENMRTDDVGERMRKEEIGKRKRRIKMGEEITKTK